MKLLEGLLIVVGLTVLFPYVLGFWCRLIFIAFTAGWQLLR